MHVFILCAGSGDRWKNHLNIPKQFIKFNGETLVDRTIRLLQPYQPKYIYPVARLGFFSEKKNVIIIDSTRSLAETIRKTFPFWGDDNVFLLGDVFYSPASIAKILRTKKDFIFFGRPWGSSLINCGHGELFGLTVKKAAQANALSLLEKIIECVAQDGVEGNLWNIHHLMSGLTLGTRELFLDNIELIDDYTNDIDTPIDYMRRKQIYEAIAENEP